MLRKLTYGLLAAAFVGGMPLALASQPPVPLATQLYEVVGVVADASGTPLVGATVTDGFTATSTDSHGHYTLPESTPGTYDLTASWGLRTTEQTKSVSLLLPGQYSVNFGLLYRLSASPYSFTVAPGTQATVVFTGWAPASACLEVTDSRTGQTAAAQYDTTTADGQSSWSSPVDVPASGSSGSYVLTATARSCATGHDLSEAARSTYTVS